MCVAVYLSKCLSVFDYICLSESGIVCLFVWLCYIGEFLGVCVCGCVSESLFLCVSVPIGLCRSQGHSSLICVSVSGSVCKSG